MKEATMVISRSTSSSFCGQLARRKNCGCWYHQLFCFKDEEFKERVGKKFKKILDDALGYSPWEDYAAKRDLAVNKMLELIKKIEPKDWKLFSTDLSKEA